MPVTLISSETTMPLNFPRRNKVRYASSMAGEIRKSVPLEAGEEILYCSAVQERANWLWMQPGVLQLTSQRLILLEHHAFSPDWILEIPRFAILHVTSPGDTDWIAISYSIGDTAKTLALRPLALRGRPSPQQTATLSRALRAFHSGELSHDFVVNAEKLQESAAEPPSYSSLSPLALLYLILLLRLGVYVAKFPGEWRAKQAYAASSDCTPQVLAARAQFEARDPKLSQAAIADRSGGFCRVQKMTVARVWSASGQHVWLIDSRGKDYDHVRALNSVDVDLWWRMRPGETVYVLLAGDQPAWIFHRGNLFETRTNPEHNFWEQTSLMLVAFLFCALITALVALVLRRTVLARRPAVFAHTG